MNPQDRSSRSPQLVIWEEHLPCGYAPRTIQLSTSDDVLFVGCKDGSVTIVEILPKSGAEGDFEVLSLEESAGSVRSICEWDESRILVGRTDGKLDLVLWRGQDGRLRDRAEVQDVTKPFRQRGVQADDPVQAVCELNSSQLFTSFRKGGCWVFEKGSDGPVRVQSALSFPAEVYGAVRFLLPLSRKRTDVRPGLWLLVTEQGELLHWSGSIGSPAVKLEPDWPEGEKPGVVNDFGLQRSDEQRRRRSPAQGAFLATDTGIYLVQMAQKRKAELNACRLSLSGLGAMCTALSYTEDHAYRYLWAADARGDCHLFWDVGDELRAAHARNQALDRRRGRDTIANEKRWGLNFRRSSQVHSDGQTLVGFSWYSKRLKALVFGQARRNDQIVFGQYWRLDDDSRIDEDVPPVPALAGEPNRTLKIRLLLSNGDQKDLKRFFKLQDEERHGADSKKTHNYSRKVWRPAALLVELFERLAADSTNRSILLESLLGDAALADKILREVAEEWQREDANTPEHNKSEDGDRRKSEAEKIVQLWTLVLMGIIHRYPHDREAAYLNLLRWLRNRQQKVTSPILVEAIEDSVRFARKWGVYGEANAWRENLIRPLSRLKEQNEKNAELDRLTYQVLLYERGVSLIAQVNQSRMRGRTAWDIATIAIDGKQLIAVSWNWGGVELFEVTAAIAADARLIPHYALRPKSGDEDYGARWEQLRPETPPSEIARHRYKYSRAIYLGVIATRPYLLTAPARKRGSGFGEEIYVWRIPWSGDAAAIYNQDEPDTKLLVEAGEPGDAGESVYRLLELEANWLLVGLRGRRGVPKIALLRLFLNSDDKIQGEWSSFLELDEPLEVGESSTASGVREVRRNRVWSLAKQSISADHIRVVVGCEGGQIYRASIRRAEESWAIDQPEPDIVARMSSPVLALAYREIEGRPTRLIAGSEDGSIVAWQEVSARSDDGSIVAWQEGLKEKRGFASLWATSESGAVANVHLLDDLPLDDSQGAVMAVTRQGRCVIFDDRAMVGEKAVDEEVPSRIPVPGGRHGRPHLRTSCFASLVLRVANKKREEEPLELEPAIVIVAASGEGTLHLIGLDDPHYTDARRRHLNEILKSWWTIVPDCHQLRQAGAVYMATPVLELILVRWLLDPNYPDNLGLKPSRVPIWSLPRHLRPLLGLRHAWDALKARVGDPTKLAEEAGHALELALRRAWQLDDVKLFQEICEVALKNGNFLLYRTVRMKKEFLNEGTTRWTEEKRQVQWQYEHVFDAIERTLHRWLGADESKEARARMIVAKHLVNGDTFWQVVAEAAEESCRREEPLFGRILSRRIMGVSELVFKRNPLVSLEALRAANLSLLRLCKRLSDERAKADDAGGLSEWCPDPGRSSAWEVHWPVFEQYFRHLIAAAARTFHSRLELNDALAHEYSRTCALAICACPSATIRIANQLTEMQLISDPDSEDDLSHRVERQLQVLAEMGLSFPEVWVYRLFRMVGRPSGVIINPLEPVLSALALVDEGQGLLASRFREDLSRTRVGVQNTYDLSCLCRLYDVVNWFAELERKFSTDARRIDFTSDEMRHLERLLEELDARDSKKLYSQSRKFWRHAVARFDQEVGTVRGVSRRIIRPEVVLQGRKIATWAEASIKDLDNRYPLSIFQPEYRSFREVLYRLKRAAKDFPNSAAVQKNIVEGVLGHHLLEELDEHVFELVEIAQAMDPLMVWRDRDQNRFPEAGEAPTGSLPATAEGFAKYLLGRSRNAESIPKNLRTLHSLLIEKAEKGREKVDLVRSVLLQEFAVPEDAPERQRGWILGTSSSLLVEIHEARFLRLTLNELNQNDQIYGLGVWQRSEDRPQVAIDCTAGDPDLEATVKIRFRFREEIRERAISRLKEIRDEVECQRPCEPWPERYFASHGTGLYLANLAAAVAGWRLRIGEINEVRATVTFHLEKIHFKGGGIDRG